MLITVPLRIAIVGDDPVLRDRVVAQLRHHRDLMVVGCADTAAEGLRLCAAERPEIILLDPRLAEASAAALVAELCRTSPDSRIPLFAAFPAAAAPLLAAGASGLLAIDPDGSAVSDAVRGAAFTGRHHTDPAAASLPAHVTS